MNDVSTRPMPVIIPNAEDSSEPCKKVSVRVGKCPQNDKATQEMLEIIKKDPQFNLERNPDSDGFEMQDQNAMVGSSAKLMAFKAPNSDQVINGLKIATTVIGLLTEVARSGRELWDVVADWFRSNPDKSDKEKAATMKMAFTLANQAEPEEMAQVRDVA